MKKDGLLYRFDLGDRERNRGNETGAGQEMTVTAAQSNVEHVSVRADTENAHYCTRCVFRKPSSIAQHISSGVFLPRTLAYFV